MSGQVKAMEAGAELDELVAIQILGWPPDQVPGATLSYSSDMSAAWEVVEKMCKKFPGEQTVNIWNHYENGEWCCVINRDKPVIAPTAPLAICRAALLAALCSVRL